MPVSRPCVIVLFVRNQTIRIRARATQLQPLCGETFIGRGRAPVEHNVIIAERRSIHNFAAIAPPDDVPRPATQYDAVTFTSKHFVDRRRTVGPSAFYSQAPSSCLRSSDGMRDRLVTCRGDSKVTDLEDPSRQLLRLGKQTNGSSPDRQH